MPEPKSEPTLQLLSLTGCPIPNPMCEKCDNTNGNKISLKTVGELLGKNFFVPSYQRGYRWTGQEVKDLLEDIAEFNAEGETFYCLQPLVVKSRRKDEYEVIDGQQRLTTIFIILKFLGGSGSQKYSLIYETREKSEGFLGNIGNQPLVEETGSPEDNIDFFHMNQAYKTIEYWFNHDFVPTPELPDKEHFLLRLLNNVKFIWYETDESDPIKVFTRLNIGKIPLTNAELIKALFLNSSNFHEKGDHLELRQQEIASEWDQIEYTLQNEEFWLFIHNKGYNNPTRIDFIFDLICNENKFELSDGEKKSIGDDAYRTFRYFYASFGKDRRDAEYDKEWDKIIKDKWGEVKKIFQTFSEWFNDLEFYHYVGYLVSQKGEGEIKDLLKTWDGFENKNQFRIELKDRIWKKVMGKIEEKDKQEDMIAEKLKLIAEKLDKTYENITDCRPLLLLHNVQSIVNQGINSTKKYGMQVFYKFPFHIYKNESWDVEHIDSNTPNDLKKLEDRRGWLFAVKDKVKDKDILGRMESFYENPRAPDFESLKGAIEEILEREETFSDPEEKNKIWNFALLDSSTNRGYGNSIFSAKRRYIIGKDKGRKIKELPEKWGGELKEEDAESSFIPPCTKYVFLKYYSPDSSDPNSWTRQDAENYRDNIFETLEEFGVKNADKSTGNTNKGDEDE